MENIFDSWYCHDCKSTFQRNVLDEANCPHCNLGEKHTHMIFPNQSSEYYPTILVKSDDYKEILPENLWYYFNMLYNQKNPKHSTFLVEYSISQQSLSCDGGKKWFKAK